MKKRLYKKFKEEKGITGIDTTIAVIILVVFVPLVASLFGNIANVSKKISRKATATNIAVQTIESIKMLQYDSIQVGDIDIGSINDVSGSLTNIPNGYSVKINVVKNLKNKEVEVSVSYPEDSSTETLKLITKRYQD